MYSQTGIFYRYITRVRDNKITACLLKHNLVKHILVKESAQGQCRVVKLPVSCGKLQWAASDCSRVKQVRKSSEISKRDLLLRAGGIERRHQI